MCLETEEPEALTLCLATCQIEKLGLCEKSNVSENIILMLLHVKTF